MSRSSSALRGLRSASSQLLISVVSGCVQLMGHIGVKGLHLPVGHGQALQQCIELVNQWA